MQPHTEKLYQDSKLKHEEGSQYYHSSKHVNPSTPMSDQERISPYNINTISSRQVMRIKKNSNLGIIS